MGVLAHWKFTVYLLILTSVYYLFPYEKNTSCIV
jgi:hypothetical protein